MMFNKLWKNKIWIVLAALVFMCLSLAKDIIIQVNKATMTLSLNYPGVEKGLNPDGTRFNVFEVMSNEVLDRAISKANVPGLTVDELKTRIDIYATMPGDISDKIKNANTQGKNFSYIPNTYSISYSQKNKLSLPYTRKVLKAVADSYSEVFRERYTDKNTVFEEFNFLDSSYEYVEIPDLFSNKISSMVDFLNVKNKENGSFRSTETNETFESLLYNLQSLKNVDVENLKAFVNVSKIYKDRNKLLEKYKYEVRMLNVDYEKAVKEAAFNKMALEQYDSSVTDVVLIPSLDENDDFYMNRTKIGIDYLTSNAYNSGVKAEKIRKQIEEKTKTINDFTTVNYAPEEQARLNQKAENMIQNIKSKLSQIASNANVTVNEYVTYLTKDYLKYNIPEFGVFNFINISYAQKAVKDFIIGLILASLFILMLHEIKKWWKMVYGLYRRIRHGA